MKPEFRHKEDNVRKAIHRIVFFVMFVSLFALGLVMQPGLGKAQDSQAVGAPAAPPTGRAWGGGGLRFLGVDASLQRKVVTGAPYSAQAITERTQVLPNGNKIDQKTTATVYRDSQGRTREERTMGPMGPWGAPNNASPMVIIRDPVAGVAYTLNPSKQSAMEHPFHAGPNGNSQGRRANLQRNNANVNIESLGTKMVAGVEAEGKRITVTIPAGRVGNAQPIEIVSEKWVSTALQVTVMETRTDPRFGTTTYELTNVNQTEPDPELFKVPSGYTTQERPAFRHGPPPPPPDVN